MAPRWISDERSPPFPHAPDYEDDDWVLLSGQYMVGRVTRQPERPNAGEFAWSVTGPFGPINTGGFARTLDQAQEQLLTAWRQWQDWAELQDRPG